MRKIFPVIFLSLILSKFSEAQSNNKPTMSSKDSLEAINAKRKTDSMNNRVLANFTYPYIRSSKWSGVVPIPFTDEGPDPSMKYKLLFEITTGIKDTDGAKEINEGLAELARIVNIHIASGIPLKNLDVVVVAHGGVLRSFYTDSSYKARYKISNPNIPLFHELLNAGVKFISCGQAMFYLDIKKENLLPWVKVYLSAQTALTNYQLKGYVWKKIVVD